MWRKIWAPHDAEQMNEMNASLAKHSISAGLFLNRLLGNYAAGLVLLEAYYSTESGEVTAEYVEARLDGFMSSDTARRRLKEMASAGKVTTRREGRIVYFRLTDELAETSMAFMKGEPVSLPGGLKRVGMLVAAAVMPYVFFAKQTVIAVV